MDMRRLNMSEKRRSPRLAINQEFSALDDFVTEYVTNIGSGGVFIRSRNPLPVGTRVELHFSIVDDDFRNLSGEGEVVHIVDDASANAGMGVRFIRLHNEGQRVVDGLLKRA